MGEPVQTCKLSSSQVNEFAAVPMMILAYPANIQRVQRVVKQVTAASVAVLI